MTQPIPEPLRTMLDDPRHDSLDGHCYEGCPCLPDRDYPHTYVMGAQANRSRKRINYTTIFCAITLIAWALAIIF